MPANFFDLPRELRDEIYRYLLTRDLDRPVWLYGNSRYFYCYGPFWPKILLTNKTILREARSILYGDNEFCFSFDHHCYKIPKLSNWLMTIGLSNSDQIRHLTIVGVPRFCVPYARTRKELEEFFVKNIVMILGHCHYLRYLTLRSSSDQCKHKTRDADLSDCNICYTAEEEIMSQVRENLDFPGTEILFRKLQDWEK
jgi:hypothetical protein